MDFNIDWDMIKNQLKEAVEIEKKGNSVKIKFKGEVPKNPMLDKITSNEGLNQTLTQFVGKGEPINCDIKFIEDENTIMLTNFKDEETVNAVHEFLNNMFFGDFLKDLLEQMMDAFKNLGDLEI